MLSAILRFIALRPLFSLVILGFPVILLIAVGLLTIMALKFLIFVVLPIVLIIWVVRKVFKNSGPDTAA